MTKKVIRELVWEVLRKRGVTEQYVEVMRYVQGLQHMCEDEWEFRQF